jgi:hypothetical protein
VSGIAKYGCAALLVGLLSALAGCESASYGVGMSYSSGYYGGYHPGYYPGYPGYWYDDDRPVVIVPPGGRPDRPDHHERPTTLPAPAPDRPSLPPARPPTARPTPMPSTRPATRPATRPMPPPRPMPRRR